MNRSGVLEANMTLTEHLRDLRKRLVASLIAVTIGFAIVYGFAEQVFALLQLPLLNAIPEGHDRRMMFTGVAQPFIIYLKVGIFGGIILALPVILYQIWLFIAPALYQRERRYMAPFIILSLLSFAVGASFAYFIAFPFSFTYFMGYTSESIQPMISVNEYLNFVTKMILGFGLMFELPLVMFILGKIGIVNARMLSRNRQWAALLIAVASAIFTPADVISMTVMAVPLYILFEVSIVIVRIVNSGQGALVDEEGDFIEDEERDDAPEVSDSDDRDDDKRRDE